MKKIVYLGNQKKNIMNKIYKNLTGSKLKAYSAMAAALTAGTSSLNAEVVYTDITDVTIGLGEAFEMDIDGDGTMDFIIAASSLTGSNGTWSFASAFGSVGSLGIGGPSNQAIGTVGPYYPYGSALDAGDEIGPDGSFLSYPSLGNVAVVASNFYGVTYGNFPGEGEKFLGVKFAIGSDIHYGWARLESDIDEVFVTIMDFAYENSADVAIEAGATVGSAVAELPAGSVNIYSFGSSVNVINNVNLVDATVRIFDLTGKLITSQTLTNGSTQIDLSAFASGNYVVTIDSNEGVASKNVYIN